MKINLTTCNILFFAVLSIIFVVYTFLSGSNYTENIKYVFVNPKISPDPEKSLSNIRIKYIEHLVSIKQGTFMLKNILSDDDLVLTNEKIEKIFFLETHQNADRKFDSARQACAIESAGMV